LHSEFQNPVFYVYREQEGILLKKSIVMFLIIAILATGCSYLPVQIPGLSQSTPTVGPTQAVATAEPTQTPQPEFTITPTMPIQPKIDAEKTISLLLDGQKAGATFALTSNLLSAAYAAKIKDDAGLAAVFGTPESIGSYKIGSPSYSADMMKAILEGTIYLPEPGNVRFSMVIENNEWKVDEITLLSSTGDYPTTPEAVVLSFLTSYQEAPDRMSNFLIPSRRAQQPPGGAAAMLQISGNLEGMVVQSAAVNPEPPSASINVVIRAGGKDYVRRFLLTKDTSLWGIDAIETTSE
jgi:hypothetical protein